MINKESRISVLRRQMVIALPLVQAQYRIIEELKKWPSSLDELIRETRLSEKVVRKALKLLIKDGAVVQSYLTRMYEIVTEEYAKRD